MDLFKDKVYEELDDISQLVEPFEYAVNNELAQFPDEIVLGSDFLESAIAYAGGRSSTSQSIRRIVEREAYSRNLKTLCDHSKDDYYFVNNFFELHIDDNTTYNATTKELVGDIIITKKKMAYEDKEIEDYLLKYMHNKFSTHFRRPSFINKPRLNEICDLFGASDALSDRSAKGKVNKLYKRYKSLIEERSLNIRDVELFKRFVNWNLKYVKDGSLPSMSNIAKVKIMMRNELPIYSIKEEEV